MTGSSDDLQVAILESDGTIQSFKIPFTLPAIALREGYLKYNVTVGQYRPSDSGEKHTWRNRLLCMVYHGGDGICWSQGPNIIGLVHWG